MIVGDSGIFDTFVYVVGGLVATAVGYFSINAYFEAQENQTAIGTVRATGGGDDSVTFSVSGDNLSINETTGVLSFVSAPDYETKSSYSFTV